MFMDVGFFNRRRRMTRSGGTGWSGNASIIARNGNGQCGRAMERQRQQENRKNGYAHDRPPTAEGKKGMKYFLLL
jgi:hypothetical protein